MRERDRFHGISAEIVKRHSPIAVEDLMIPNMVKSRHLSRLIAEQQSGRLAR